MTLLTELDAVNQMLRVIGEQPTNTLEEVGFSQVELARQTLNDTSRIVQSQGWWFNTENKYKLMRDQNNKIPIPAGVLQLDASDDTKNYTPRGVYLYDLSEHTDTFKDNVEVDLVAFLPFEELPQTARTYITLKAARTFQMIVLGSELIHQTLAGDEMAAYLMLRSEDTKFKDCNILQNNSYIQRLKRR